MDPHELELAKQAHAFVTQCKTPSFESLLPSQQEHYRRVALFALDESNRRARLLAAKLSQSGAEFLTRPHTLPHEAIREAMQYAGLEPVKIQLIDGDKVVGVF